MPTTGTARRTKTYIAFDGDEDLMSYRTIQSWSADETVAFSLNDAHELTFARDDSLPESIINQLGPRLEASKHMVLIVSGKTSRNRKGILKYELNYALKHALPIILIFKGFSETDRNTLALWQKKLLPRIPSVVSRWQGDKYCVVCPFTRNAVCSAIQRFSHRSLPSKGYEWCWQ